MATPEFTQKLDALSQLSSKDLQQKIDDTAQLAAQGLTLDGKNVTAEKIIIGNFKAEIHPETGLTRRTSSTDRAQILKDDFSIENYFGRLANSSDQVQYPDPDNNASKLMQPSIMTAAHGVVAALHAMVTVRPKLILDAQKAADKKGQDAQRRKEVVGHLGSAFGDLLNQPTEKLLDKTPTTTSLEVQLANYGIKASPDVMAVFAALKRAKTVSAFAKSLAQKIDGVLGLPSPEDLGRGLLDSIGIKADNKSAEEIGKIIAGSVRSSALSQIAKGKNINITLPEPGTVLLNMLKTTKEIPDDLEQVLKKPLSAEGVVFTEMEKQQLKAQVIFGLIQYTKKEKLPVTESGKIDVAKFNVIFNDLANGAYLRLHPTATELPFKNEVEEQPIDLDITKHMPDLILGMKEAIENFAGGDLSKIVKATRAQLLDFAIKYLVVEGIIDQTLEKYTRKYFESVVAGLEGEFLSRLRVGKRLDTFSSVDELLKVIMPSGKKATVALQNTSDASMPPPPPPPPPPPSFGVPGDTGSMPPPPPQSAMNQNAKYALAGSDISIEALDPKGTDRIISQTILVDPLHIFLTFSSLWSEAEKRKELAQIEREREEENAKLIARMAGNLGYLLEGHLHLKQPVVSVAQDESASKDELSGVALRKTASKSSAGTNKSQFKGRDVVSEVEQQRLIKQSQFDRQAYLEDDNRIEKINRDRQELRAILGYSADSLSDDQVRKELEDRGVKSGVSKKQTVSARDSSKALLNASEADKLDPKQIPDMSSVLQGIREGIKLNKSGNDVDPKVTGAQNTATPKKLSSRVKRGLGKHNSSNPVEVQ